MRLKGKHNIILKDNKLLLNKMLFCRGGGPEPPEVDPAGHSGFTPDLLLGVLWCVCRPDSHDAVLFAQRSQPAACGLYIHRLGPCKVCSGCGIPLCIVNKV